MIDSEYLFKALSDPGMPKCPVRPPLGITPFYIWNEQRKKDIEEAIIRYTLAEMQVPKEWVAELQTLTANLK